jgi:hypothetical protein
MGGNQSQVEQITNITNDTVMSVMSKNSTTCEQSAKIIQKIKITGTSGDVSITDTTMKADINMTGLCLLNSTFSAESVAKISNDLKAELEKKMGGLNLAVAEKDSTSVKNNIINNISSTTTIENIAKGMQQAKIEQGYEISDTGGNVSMSKVKLDASMTLVQKVINSSTADIINTALGTNKADTSTKVTQENAMTPLTNMISNAINAYTSMGTTMMIVVAIIVCVIGYFMYKTIIGVSENVDLNELANTAAAKL